MLTTCYHQQPLWLNSVAHPAAEDIRLGPSTLMTLPANTPSSTPLPSDHQRQGAITQGVVHRASCSCCCPPQVCLCVGLPG